MNEPKILVTGANGQIGQVLTERLREKYGSDNVIASDIKESVANQKPFLFLDILNTTRLREIIQDHKITQIYHLAAILSAHGEYNPEKTWNINLNGSLALLQVAVASKVDRVFFPSTIGVFGPTTPKINTPQHSALMPNTVYGISKVTGELWSNYYWQRYQLDVRSVRYPGIIGYNSIPEGGTTDYAVEIFHQALDKGHYTCFLKPDTYLPMIYMQDAIKATMLLMEAEVNDISIRTSYNLSSMSFSPREIAAEIKKHIPQFTISYEPDFRQEIAESWTQSIDDHAAREDWKWNPDYDLRKMTSEILYKLESKLNLHV